MQQQNRGTGTTTADGEANRLTAREFTRREKALKRILDIIFSIGFLCTVFPLTFIVITILKLATNDKAPLFFIQERTGYHDRSFRCIKFGTMRRSSNANKIHARVNDERITPLGNVLRRTSIDEFPQFINVLLGQMSVVGPRPHMLLHTEIYSVKLPYYMERHKVLPGVTGYAQVKGLIGPTHDLQEMDERVRADIEYINHYSIWLDCKLICETIINLVRSKKNEVC